MSETLPFLVELVHTIDRDLLAKRFDAVNADVDILAETCVAALVEGRDRDLAAGAQAIERAYTRHLIDNDLLDAPDDTRSSLGQVQAFTKLLHVALRHRRPAAQGDVLRDEKYAAILQALFKAPEGLSGRQLAEQTGEWPETIARKTVHLRNAHTTGARRAGRSTINFLLPKAREELKKRLEEMARAPKPTPISPLTFEDLFIDVVGELRSAKVQSLEFYSEAEKRWHQLRDTFYYFAGNTRKQVRELDEIPVMLNRRVTTPRSETGAGFLGQARDIVQRADSIRTLETGLTATLRTFKRYELDRYHVLKEWSGMMGWSVIRGLVERHIQDDSNMERMLARQMLLKAEAAVA